MTTTTIKDEATCERKQSFSYARAQQVARQMRRCDDEPVIAYRCRACGKWHVACGRRRKQGNQEVVSQTREGMTMFGIKQIHQAKYEILPAATGDEFDEIDMPIEAAQHARCRFSGCNTILRRGNEAEGLCSVHQPLRRRRYLTVEQSDRVCADCGCPISTNNKCGLCSICKMEADDKVKEQRAQERAETMAQRARCIECGSLVDTPRYSKLCAACREAKREVQLRAGFSDASWNIVASEYNAGESVRELAAKHGISRAKIRQILVMRGITVVNGRRCKVVFDAIVKLVEEYAAGASITALSKKYKVSFGLIRDRLVHAGVALRDTREFVNKRIDDEAVARDRAQGMTITCIARKHGVSPAGVVKALRRARRMQNNSSVVEVAHVA